MKPMRLLVLTGELYPIPGNNANLLFKLLPYLVKNCEVRVLSTAVLSVVTLVGVFFLGRGSMTSSAEPVDPSEYNEEAP